MRKPSNHLETDGPGNAPRAVNQHDAETRQFLALVEAQRPGLAFALGVIRSPVALKMATIVGVILLMIAAFVLGAPQQVLAMLLSKLA